ncbi:MAG: class I SAM-dependent methyltransferase [Candidatus Omnitrophica bacterium]|nr:class I SAM-dependent methyltransferase [Candidatus Omnitrophota bacterium]
MAKSVVKKYFEENAESWVADGYGDDGYTYPVGHHRTRIVLKVLSGLGNSLKVVDLGCGGGQLSCALAESGHTVVGIDQSDKMVNIAQKNRSTLPAKLQKRINIIRCPIESNNLKEHSFDAVTAMGLIGYLRDDNILFKIAHRLLKPNGIFLVSCRNRLFNMVSITPKTKREIRSKTAMPLISELESLYKTVSKKDADELVQRFKHITASLPNKTMYGKMDMLSPAEKLNANPYRTQVEARQHTPKNLLRTAMKFGFSNKAYYGVHPHIIAPPANRLLPPGIFNKISNCLEALEHLPVSLIWSSVFIGVFKKKKEKNHEK